MILTGVTSHRRDL